MLTSGEPTALFLCYHLTIGVLLSWSLEDGKQITRFDISTAIWAWTVTLHLPVVRISIVHKNAQRSGLQEVFLQLHDWSFQDLNNLSQTIFTEINPIVPTWVGRLSLQTEVILFN